MRLKLDIYFFLKQLFTCILFAVWGNLVWSQEGINFHKLDSIERIANNPEIDDSTRLRKYRDLVHRTIYNDLDLGAEKLKAYRKFAEGTNNTNHLLRVLHFETYMFQKRADYPAALRASREAIAITQSLGSTNKLGQAYMDRGTVFEAMGNLDSALFCYTFASKITPEKSVNDYTARVNINLGGIYEKQGNFRQSLHCFEKARFICESTKQVGYLAAVYRCLGNVNTSIGEYERAANYYSKSVIRSIKQKNNNTKYQALERWAAMKVIEGKYDAALYYYKRAIDVAKLLEAPMDLATAKCGIANAYSRLNKKTEAKNFIEQALGILSKESKKTQFYTIYVTAGEIYFQLEDLQKSKHFAQMGYPLAKKANDIEYLARVCEVLYKIHKKQGNQTLTLKFHEEWVKYRDVGRNFEQTKDVITNELNLVHQQKILTDSLKGLMNLRKLKANHDAQIREEGIAFVYAILVVIILLILTFSLVFAYYQKQKRNRLLEGKNEVIRNALKDKDVLLKEVNHRVKNNMQMISGLLYLKAKGTDDVNAKAALIDSQSRIHTMALAHQKMYQSTHDQDVLNITDYIQDILATITHDEKMDDSDSFVVEGQALFITVENAQTLGFIVHELITNSFKYAWEAGERRKILVTLSESDGRITVSYLDNGARFPQGISLESVSSFGLKMIQTFVLRQLKGSIQIIPSPGAHFKIEFGAEG